MRRDLAKKRILVMRYRFIGDTILTVPFLRNLRRAEPDAWIVWLVAPDSSNVVKGIPYADELLIWDPATTHADCRNTHRTFAAKLSFIREIRSMRFDKVYVLKRSLSSALIAFLSGARERIGFDTEGRGILLTRKVPYRRDRHEVLNFLDLLKADGVPVEDDYLEAWLTDDEQSFAAEFLARQGVGESERLVAIHPFAANQTRAWHEENFAAVANEIQKRYRVRIVLFGGPRDQELGRYFAGAIIPAPVMAVGSTSLRQTMALLARCSLLICNDSGIMHLGAALNVPLVALFGPQSPAKFGPWGETCQVLYKGFPCSPCKQKFFKECGPSPRMKPQCMEDISIAELMEAIAKCEGDLVRVG